MLFFDIRSLNDHAAPVSGSLEPSDPVFEGTDAVPASPVEVSGRVSCASRGRYYWSGRITGTIELSCSRCLEPVTLAVNEEVRALFSEAGLEEEDDPDVYALERGSSELDLRPAVREHWLLAVPRFALCREDCRGLCPQCGENRNVTTCSCAPARDSRWDALRDARLS